MVQAKVFVVRKDESFVEHIALAATKVTLHPFQFVAPCRRVVPRGGGKDVEFVTLLEFPNSLYGAWHGFHHRKDTRHIVQTVFVCLLGLFVQLVNS